MASKSKAPCEQKTLLAPQKWKSGGNVVETNEAQENEADEEMPTREGGQPNATTR
jgi:hypothetical protein